MRLKSPSSVSSSFSILITILTVSILSEEKVEL
jgi:hypothetical protein